MRSSPDDADLEARLHPHESELGLLASEADRQLGDEARRAESAVNRATLLISSAAIASGIQLSGTPSIWQALAVVFTLAAASLAIPVILFRKEEEVSIDDLQEHLYNWSPMRMQLDVLNTKRAILKNDREALARRAAILRLGFLSLAFSIFFTGLQITGLFLSTLQYR